MGEDRGRDAHCWTPTGWAEAVACLRLPQNVACRFPALRSSGVGSQHLVCYSFESCFHGRRFISLHRWPYLPLHGGHVAFEQFNARWPLPHVAGSPDLGVLSASLTAAGPSDRSRRFGLAGPTSVRLSPTALPCSHGTFGQHAGGTNPGSISRRSPWRVVKFCLPPSGIRSATSTTIDFGANCPFTFVPAYCLPVYASQSPLPDPTQDSVRGCRLSFAAVAISGDMVSCAFKAQTGWAEAVACLRLPQNVACRFPALRSSGVGSQHLVCYSFESCFHGRRFISLHRWPYLPLHGGHVAFEQFNARWPLPHVAGSPDLGVLSASLTAAGPSDRSRRFGLAGPTSVRLSPTALPCSHGTFGQHAGGTNPGSISRRSPWRVVKFCLPPSGIRSATSTTI